MHATIWKFERKNFQEYHHMVWNGTTNRLVEKGLFASCPALLNPLPKTQLNINLHEVLPTP